MFHKCSDTGSYNHRYYYNLVYLASVQIANDSLDVILISTHHCCKQLSYLLHIYLFSHWE